MTVRLSLFRPRGALSAFALAATALGGCAMSPIPDRGAER